MKFHTNDLHAATGHILKFKVNEGVLKVIWDITHVLLLKGL